MIWLFLISSTKAAVDSATAVRGEVVHDERAHVGARAFEGGCGIVFAVVAWEHGDDHVRLGDTGAGVYGLLRSFEGNSLNGLALLVALGTVREHGFDAALPSVLQFGQIKRLTGCHELSRPRWSCRPR